MIQSPLVTRNRLIGRLQNRDGACASVQFRQFRLQGAASVARPGHFSPRMLRLLLPVGPRPGKGRTALHIPLSIAAKKRSLYEAVGRPADGVHSGPYIERAHKSLRRSAYRAGLARRRRRVHTVIRTPSTAALHQLWRGAAAHGPSGWAAPAVLPYFFWISSGDCYRLHTPLRAHGCKAPPISWLPSRMGDCLIHQRMGR